MLKKYTAWTVLTLLVIGLLTIGGLAAQDLELYGRENNIVFGNEVLINQNIDATAIIFGNNVEINADINGDLLVFGQTIKINGVVSGDIYAFSSTLRLSNVQARDVFAFGSRINLEPEAIIGRDFTGFSDKIFADGTVGRDLRLFGTSVALNAQVGRDATVHTDDITLSGSPTVGGKLYYESNAQAIVPQTAVVNDIEWGGLMAGESYAQNQIFNFVWEILSAMVVALCIWLVMTFFAPAFNKKATFGIEKKLGRTVLTGFIAAIAVPVLALGVLLLTYTMAAGISVVLMLFYGAAMYLAFGVAVNAITNALVKKLKFKPFSKNLFYVLIVAFVVKVLTYVPVFGIFVVSFYLLLGMGLLFGFLFKKDVIDEPVAVPPVDPQL